MDEKTVGLNHPTLAIHLNNLAFLLSAQGKYDEAKSSYERAINIWEKVYGPNHPKVATGLNNLAVLLNDQVGWWYRSIFLLTISNAEKTRRSSSAYAACYRYIYGQASS